MTWFESIEKVDIESQSELSNALYGLGIEDAFIPFKADFTKMSNNSGISLTNVSLFEDQFINTYDSLPMTHYLDLPK